MSAKTALNLEAYTEAQYRATATLAAALEIQVRLREISITSPDMISTITVVLTMVGMAAGEAKKILDASLKISMEK